MTLNASSTHDPHPLAAALPARTRWGQRIGSVLIRALATVILGLALKFLWLPGGQQFPAHRVLESAALKINPGEQVLLGDAALAAPRADALHLRVRRPDAGAPWLENVSAGKGLLAIRDDGSEQPVRSLLLAAGQQILIAGEAWKVLSTRPSLRLQGPSGRWQYDGVALHRVGDQGELQPQSAGCPDVPGMQQWGARLNQLVPRFLARATALSWGGGMSCGLRLAHSRLWPDSIQIKPVGPDFLLTAKSAVARQVCIGPTACARTLFEQTLSVNGLSRLVLGRTHFSLHWEAATSTLRLETLRRGGWLGTDAVPPQLTVLGPDGQVMDGDPGRLVWRTRPYPVWSWTATHWGGKDAWAVMAAGLGLVAAWALLLGWRWKLHWCHALAAGLVTLWLALALDAVLGVRHWGPGASLVLAACSLLSAPWWAPRLGWVWLGGLAMALMLGAGLGLQIQLALEGADAGAFLPVQTMAATLGLSQALLAGVCLAVRHHSQRGSDVDYWFFQPGQWPLDAALSALTLAVLALLGLQVLFGSELGVFGVQPVELVKFLLVLLGAHALAVRMEWSRAGHWRHWLELWWRLAFPLLVLVALVSFALMMVHDWSPLILVGAWALAMMAAWAAVRRSSVALLGLLVLLAGLGAGMHWLQGEGVAWMKIHGFYGERFAVWQDPLRFPHSGEQIIRALNAVALGGWWGDPLIPGGRIPAAQSDMALSFFMARHGLAGGLILLGVQLLYTGCLVALGWQAACAVRSGNVQQRWGQRLVFFAAWGAAGIFMAHWFLAWGTNTSLTPVMGQPAPFIALANSLILGFVTPLHALFLLRPGWVRPGP